MSSTKDLPASVTASTLEQLFRGKTEGVDKTSIFPIDPELVEFEPNFNLRDYENDDITKAHAERMYLAMKEGASFPPIDVRVSAGKVICVEGHGRVIAAKRLREEVPSYRLQARQFNGNEQERVLHMLGTGSGQKPLTPLEQGLGFLRLKRYGMTDQQIAQKLGISTVTVANNLILADAPVDLQNLIRSGDVASTTVRDAMKQGEAGVNALLDAATSPQPAATNKDGKKSKKKTVTAKTLKGTAADKKAKPKKPEKKKTVKNWNKMTGNSVAIPEKKDAPITLAQYEKLIPAAPVRDEYLDLITSKLPVADDEIMVKVKKSDAQAVIDFLRANAPDDAQPLKDFAAAIEVLLM